MKYVFKASSLIPRTFAVIPHLSYLMESIDEEYTLDFKYRMKRNHTATSMGIAVDRQLVHPFLYNFFNAHFIITHLFSLINSEEHYPVEKYSLAENPGGVEKRNELACSNSPHQ